jgi:hypothetical protein
VTQARKAQQAKDIPVAAVARAARVLRMRALQSMVRANIDDLEPEHHKGRYGGTCHDATLAGALRTAFDQKDSNCPRCRLLTFASGAASKVSLHIVVQGLSSRGEDEDDDNGED